MSKAAQKKEEERIEKIIRNLLKLPENRRCINCTSLGPQYVCTTFWTFVCTNCSGVHREFTHRVKSVSMAKFTAEEVSALQAGGNERAQEIYFKVWDPQRHAFPDGSNQNRLRDFIKQVYVDRKYAGESTAKKTLELKEEPSRRRSVDNPRYGGRTEDGGSNYHIDDRRSPRFSQDSGRNRNRPTRFEIVDDRFKDDDFSHGRRSDTRRVYNSGSKSPISRKTREKTSPPTVSIKDFLGEDIPPLQVGKSPEANDDAKNNKNTDPQEKPVSTGAKGPIDAKTPEFTKVKPVSLIDLVADPEPSDSTAAPQTQETAPSTVGSNEGLVNSPRTVDASNAPKMNSLELMLFELSAPGEVPGNVNIANAAPAVGEVHKASTAGTELIMPCCSSDSMVAGNDGLQLTTFDDISYTTQRLNPPAGISSDQARNLSPVPNAQSSSSAAVAGSSQLGQNVAQDITSQTGPQASSMEAKSKGRGELPMDLFTGSYPSFQAPVQNWQFRPPHGMGFNMYQHYPTNSMPGASFSNLARSRNPFDLNDDTPQMQTAMHPSMLPVQDASSNFLVHHAIVNASQTTSSQFMPSRASPYQAMPPTQVPTYGISPGPGNVSGAFSGQQLPYGMPLPGSQGDNGVGKLQQNDPFAALSPLQQRKDGEYTVLSMANSSPSAEGNPFG